MDLEPFDTLELRVRGDGRKYVATLRTETWVSLPGESHDLWQAFLFAPPGEWSSVHLPFSRFLKTWRGRVLETEEEMNSRAVLSVGIALAGGSSLQPPGPFRLEIAHIVARKLGN